MSDIILLLQKKKKNVYHIIDRYPFRLGEGDDRML